MIDRSNLNRVKGILSAKQGAEIPKYQLGAQFAKAKKTATGINNMIYSSDGITWFTNLDLSEPYQGSIAGYIDVDLPKEEFHYSIPGDPKVTPTTAVESAAEVNTKVADKKEQAVVEEQSTNQRVPIQPVPEPPKINVPPAQIYTQKDDPIKTASKNINSAGLSLIEQNQQVQDKKAKTLEQVGQITTGVFNAVGDAIGAKQMATDSTLTKGADAVYDMASDFVENLGPVGKVVGTAMKFASTAGDIIQEMGGGTDQMTTTDKWMDSSFFSWNIGMLNGFGGKRSDTFAADQDILAQVGSSYGGTANDILDAASTSGKKYGLFSSKARRKANTAMSKASLRQNLMGDIADSTNDDRLLVQSMGEQQGLANAIAMSGGYSQKYTYAAKHGGLLEWNPTEELEWQPQVELNWELPAFKEGGNIELTEELEWIPELQSGNKIRTIEELIEYAKKQNPRFIQRLSEKPRGIKFTDDNGNEVEGSHYLESRGEYVVPRIQEINGELKFLSSQEAIDRAMESGNYLKMTPEEAILFAEKYKQGWPDFFKKFKKGGSVGEFDIPEIEETTQKNVIPEGALHKNKHHMEHAEGLTKKGIPVIDEDGEQQAEIEHSEIIFTLEVTKKLEEYYEIFYSDEASNKEKDQAAIEAGKLLVFQILENTDDRTGLIESCREGGSLTLKKSTDDLIEEILEWMPTIIVIEEEVKEKPKKKSEKDQMKEAIKEVLIELLTK